MIYKLEIEMRPQHLEDVAVWCMIQLRLSPHKLLHNFPAEILQAIQDTKAIKPDKMQAITDFLDEQINLKFKPIDYETQTKRPDGSN